MIKHYIVKTYTSTGRALETQTMPEISISAVAHFYLTALKAAGNGPQAILPVRMFVYEKGNPDNSLDIAIGYDFMTRG